MTDEIREVRAICALCRKPAELRESHIIPTFVYRWLKDTSFTGYLRAGTNVKKRVQDGLKRKLLCAKCEVLLNPWETALASQIFHPYNANNAFSGSYGEWMLKFCTSVSWRALRFFLDEGGSSQLTNDQITAANKALERWRAVIFGEIEHPGVYEQHILPLSAIGTTSIADLPNNMNRYLMRGVELDLPRSEKSMFTYVKMGRFAVFGIISPTKIRWKGTRVSVRNGQIGPSQFILPQQLVEYLKDRARKMADLMKEIPTDQANEIERSILHDRGRAVATDQFAAMLEDERMFGRDAILRKTTES
ncbi:MAG: hypothetical protein EXQ89_02020 [Rhodospirillaceae bacterium]|nr:hypothetical protein [Rhodospirillaceae bacterium]